MEFSGISRAYTIYSIAQYSWRHDKWKKDIIWLLIETKSHSIHYKILLLYWCNSIACCAVCNNNISNIYCILLILLYLCIVLFLNIYFIYVHIMFMWVGTSSNLAKCGNKIEFFNYLTLYYMKNVKWHILSHLNNQLGCKTSDNETLIYFSNLL